MESFRKTGRAGPLGGRGTLDTTPGVRQRLHSETSGPRFNAKALNRPEMLALTIYGSRSTKSWETT